MLSALRCALPRRAVAVPTAPRCCVGRRLLCTAATTTTTTTTAAAAAKAPDHLATEKQSLSRADADEEALNFLQTRGSIYGIKLSLEERKLIVADADTNGDGKLTKAEWRALIDRHAEAAREQRTLSQYILKTIDQYQGQHWLRATLRLGVCFWCITGANIAGEAGMHAVGATVVGLVTAVTGGSFNAVLLNERVGWVRDPSLLVTMIAFCLAGFYLWPLADRGMQAMRENGHLGPNLHFISTHLAPPEGKESVVRYGLESVGLGAAAVVAAQQGIVNGLHPLMSACLSITIAFGGAARDILCLRDVRLNHRENGSESYAISALSGGFVYVGLRELHVRNCSGSSARLLSGGIPIGLRISLSIATSVAVRALIWRQRPDKIFWSMDTAAEKNEAALRSFFEVQAYSETKESR